MMPLEKYSLLCDVWHDAFWLDKNKVFPFLTQEVVKYWTSFPQVLIHT